jgi:uncharacterized protein Yka (UPF0111/DUF47 family)
MTEKNRIISALGENRLLLPALLNAALAADDQIKYLFTLLQTARNHADHPGASVSNLQQERIASGLDDEDLDNVIAASSPESRDSYRIPGAERIVSMAMDIVKSMLEPLDVGSPGEAVREFTQRYQRFLLNGLETRGDTISAESISRMTSTNRDRGDSVHLLAMDLHNALNRLQSSIATETIDGARAYEIRSGDRSLVRAFMKGVNQTAPLKFDHVGLGTTATHANGKLVIQNDIGTTDAHVLVVHIDEDSVTVTYTDVHLQRLLFFESLFERYHVRWDDAVSRRDKSMEDGVYHLSVGHYTAGRRGGLEEFLAFLGSRLVFLIDWNRARKRLRNFLPKQTAIDTLKWAADENHGHMAFLKMGGDQLVHEALEFVVKGPHRSGERLDALLGAHDATQCLRFVLKTCSEGLRQGHPPLLIRDEIKAELLNHFRGAQQSLLDVALAHAALIVEIAGGVHEALLHSRMPAAAESIERNARRAKEWERKADELVNEARSAAKIGDSGAFFRKLVEAADDVADALEDAAFHFTLVPKEGWPEKVRQPVLDMAQLLSQGAREYVKALETARYIHRGALREDTQDFLESIYHIAAIEQRSDESQRGLKRALVCDSLGHRELFVYSEAVKRLEGAADGLMHAGLMLRDHMLGEVMSR